MCGGCGRALAGQRVRWCSESCRAVYTVKLGVTPKIRRAACRACGASLADKIRGAQFCGAACSRRHRRRIARAALTAARQAASAA